MCHDTNFHSKNRKAQYDSFASASWLILRRYSFAWLVCVVTHSGVWGDALKCVTWPIHMCDMTYSNVWHDSFARVCLCVYICDMTHSDVCIFISVSWLICICDITHSWLIHLCVKKSLIRDRFTWEYRVCTCNVTPSYVRHDSFVTNAEALCGGVPHVWHDWFTCVTRLVHTSVTSHFCLYMLLDAFT